MKRLRWASLLSLSALLAVLVNPAFAAQNGNVVASATVVSSQITRLGFLTSAPVKEVAVSEGDQVTAGQTLILLNTPDLEYNVIASQEAFRSAQADAELQRYKRVLDMRNGKKFWDLVPPEVRQRADARAASAQAALEIAQAILAQSTLIAPHDATVVSIDVVPGEYVQQNQIVITLATLDDLQIKTTDLSERDITKIKIGAPAGIFIEALNETITGNVTGISPKASMIGGDIVFKVTISLDKQPKGLLWGMTAEVTIEE
jgi:RND family efflux transporter MFP subunit